eukprot:gb/GECG01001291.1/.p1 GENE.gb/GECG01001291.1/~~gb/GECG01001291.1/.p1  ORF type:complete len:268 (+),score=25.85 gb/GECG01001291.1/:1-804(+)
MSYAWNGTSNSRLSTFQDLSRRLESHGLPAQQRPTELYRCLDQCISRIKTRKRRDNRVDSQRQTHEANGAIAPRASDTKQLRGALDEQVNYNQTIRSRIQRNALYLQHLDGEILAKHRLALPQRSRTNQSATTAAGTCTSSLISLRQREQLLAKTVKQLTQIRERLMPYAMDRKDSGETSSTTEETFELPSSWKSATDDLGKRQFGNALEAEDSMIDVAPSKGRNSRSGPETQWDLGQVERPPKLRVIHADRAGNIQDERPARFRAR